MEINRCLENPDSAVTDGGFFTMMLDGAGEFAAH